MWSSRAATCRSLAGSITSQFAAQVGDAFLDQPPVDLQLLFAGAAHARCPSLIRDRWVHMRFSRGSEYSSWASSTASRASWVRAFEAKMSRISSVRSRTLTCDGLFQIRVCPGTQVVVEDHDVGLAGCDQCFQFLDFAFAQIRRRIGRPALQQPAYDFAPAVVASPSSSPGALRELPSEVMTRTSTARSRATLSKCLRSFTVTVRPLALGGGSFVGSSSYWLAFPAYGGPNLARPSPRSICSLPRRFVRHGQTTPRWSVPFVPSSSLVEESQGPSAHRTPF